MANLDANGAWKIFGAFSEGVGKLLPPNVFIPDLILLIHGLLIANIARLNLRGLCIVASSIFCILFLLMGTQGVILGKVPQMKMQMRLKRSALCLHNTQTEYQIRCANDFRNYPQKNKGTFSGTGECLGTLWKCPGAFFWWYGDLSK